MQSGVGYPLPACSTKPERIRPTEAAITVERAPGWNQGVRGDDTLGTLSPYVLTLRLEAASEAATEAKLRHLRAVVNAAAWLVRAGRSALAVSGGFVSYKPVKGSTNKLDVTVTLAPVATQAVGLDGGTVDW